MISEEEAARRGLGVVRGIIVGVVLAVLLFWLPLAVWLTHRAR
jgi:tetrahydromethanopterin S-methyltransferase subunit F